MSAIEQSVEEERVVKKAKMINSVDSSNEEGLTLSQNQTVPVDVNKGNEQVPVSDMENKNVGVCPIVVEEGKENCAEPESKEGKVEDSGLSLAENTNVDSIEEVDALVSSDANIEKLPGLEVEKKSEEIRSNPSVSGKKLLVLDLNGLLADIVPRSSEYKADINIGRKAIFRRPFCEDFLKFCFDKFEVGIWSSRMKRNVERITDFLLADMKSKLLFCWDMSHCSTTTIGSLENKNKYVVFKDLNRLWDKHDAKLPWEKGVYNATNTVLLDDSPYKALLNPPYTAIFPQSYNHQNKADTSLGNGGDLRLYLEKLVEAENVQDFIKNNPFGQESITEASENWEFYRGAMNAASIVSQK